MCKPSSTRTVHVESQECNDCCFGAYESLGVLLLSQFTEGLDEDGSPSSRYLPVDEGILPQWIYVRKRKIGNHLLHKGNVEDIWSYEDGGENGHG